MKSKEKSIKFAGVQDASVLVRRSALDLLLVDFPVHRSKFSRRDKVNILTAALNTILWRIRTLNRYGVLFFFVRKYKYNYHLAFRVGNFSHGYWAPNWTCWFWRRSTALQRPPQGTSAFIPNTCYKTLSIRRWRQSPCKICKIWNL